MTNDGPDRSTEPRDDVGKLLRLAAGHDAVPVEREQRVRESVRSHWQRGVRRRRTRRYSWLAAALAAVAVVGWFMYVRQDQVAGPPVARPMATVASLAGETRVSDHSVLRALLAAETLEPGATIDTGDRGRAALRLASGHSVRLDRNSRVRLSQERTLTLERGALYVDSTGSAAAGPALTIETPLGAVTELGTQFEVRLDGDSMRVRLREGAVEVVLGAGSQRVVTGAELSVEPDGSTRTRRIASHGTDWDWIAEVTPMIDPTGRSAREFLEWFSRERGLTLQFADRAAVAHADATVVQGSLDGLTIDQALDAVLPACDMSYRLEDGALIVAIGA